MSKITTVFLDLDSVIVNLSEAIYLKLGLPFNSCADLLTDNQVYEAAGGKSAFWKLFGTREFFGSLNLYPWSKELINVIDSSGIDWVFLSKSTRHGEVAAGKSDFIKKRLNKYSDRLWLARGSKARASGSGKILIDDKMINLVEWQRVGGTGFLWSELHPSETGEAARRIIELKLILTEEVK